MPDETTQMPNDTEDEEGAPPAPPPTGPMTPAGQGAQFTAAQQEYLGKLLADERRTAVRKLKESDEYKQLAARARRADEIEGQGRQEIEEATAALAKAKAERAQALAQAENALIRAQVTAIASQRGIPSERINDAFLLMDRSAIKADLNEGTVSGAEDAVESLVSAKPWLVGPGVAPVTTHRDRPAPNLNGGATGAPASDESRIAAVMNEMAARGHGRL